MPHPVRVRDLLAAARADMRRSRRDPSVPKRADLERLRCGPCLPLGFEENRTAVSDAWESAKLNRARNVRFTAGTLESALGRLRKELRDLAPGSSAAILDPPRAGCTKPVLKALRDFALGRIVYDSCNPATFARDADRLVRSRWRLQRVQPVDLFPQTPHVELVALFDRT